MNTQTIERKLLLKRIFPRSKLFAIGKELGISYFNDLQSGWDINLDKAALEITLSIDDAQLKKIVDDKHPRTWAIFKGQHYTFEAGKLRLEGFWKEVHDAIDQIKLKYGASGIAVLQQLLRSTQGCNLYEIKQNLKQNINPAPILADLEKLKVIITSYKGKKLREWKILEETTSIIQAYLVLTPTLETATRTVVSHAQPVGREDSQLIEEYRLIEKMDQKLHKYLNELMKYRLKDVVAFGKSFSITTLASYLTELFGTVLYFDSLLSITQQYGLADVPIIYKHGRTGMGTGWNLSLFGEPGTGKSFSTRDVILGKLKAKVKPHGVPGRNRYTAGLTPARFIRLGQAYSDKVFNFIVPEFNDWFKYKGMVEPLKLAMERGEIKYETFREVIGPYRFNSFLSVNYNVDTLGKGYEATIKDPNFKAIEDRMLCRLHRLTKQRFIEIAESQMRLALGEIDVESGAQMIRDHLTLVYAIQTKHQLVKDEFKQKPMMLTPKVQSIFIKARKAILDEIPGRAVNFSARLEERAIRFASAASIPSYFKSKEEYIPISREALKYAVQLYVEEASVRSREEFTPETVLAKISIT